MTVLPNTRPIREYVNKWLDVATDGNVSAEYAWHPDVNRMRLTCKICAQELACGIPETPEKIDYALQKFVGLHRHAAFVPPTETSIDVETNKWGYVPISTKKINRATLKDEEGRRFRE